MFVTQERAIKNAFHSAQMEGLKITDEVEADVRKMLSGELTIEQYAKKILRKGQR